MKQPIRRGMSPHSSSIGASQRALGQCLLWSVVLLCGVYLSYQMGRLSAVAPPARDPTAYGLRPAPSVVTAPSPSPEPELPPVSAPVGPPTKRTSQELRKARVALEEGEVAELWGGESPFLDAHGARSMAGLQALPEDMLEFDDSGQEAMWSIVLRYLHDKKENNPLRCVTISFPHLLHCCNARGDTPNLPLQACE